MSEENTQAWIPLCMSCICQKLTNNLKDVFVDPLTNRGSLWEKWRFEEENGTTDYAQMNKNGTGRVMRRFNFAR